ncbi:hypothetical protein CAPTEDRAFT_194682 [Capitella teleta]|uniref:Sulfotransferase domain-containing protein n=1 Tax=Capitella teleta TaxID=283909 RepID=R7TP10_CAPTE|nr:hypothetical protein CAPTEDRAFT_194682 [Capitella teleta]|eukprot:ELT95369.1 hypothetical protein CAPTEDRAFT_194682 [Capitella teleta]
MDSLNPNLTPGDLKGFIRHNYTTLAIQHAPLLSLILRFKRFIICALFICSIYTLLICSVEEQNLDSSKEPIEAELEAHANCTRLKFRSGDDRPKTALVSYPGSGNTWSRHLVELITDWYQYRHTQLFGITCMRYHTIEEKR